MERNIFENDGRLKIIKDGKTFVLSDGWELDDVGSYDFSLKLQDKAFAHGSYAVGDGCVKGRTIKVSFDLKRASEEEHDEIVNEATAAFTQRDYVLYAGRFDRCFRVAGASKIKHKYQKGFKQRWSDIEISLLLAEPFRYATTPTTATHFCGSGTEVSIYNPSSIDVPLIFTFTPLESTTVPSIEITHKESTDAFSVKDTLLTSPAVAVVNGETGTVRRNEGNSLNTFSGLFLKALPGQNTYVYKGSECTVGVTFTARWFV